jgi:hypothetical protein
MALARDTLVQYIPFGLAISIAGGDSYNLAGPYTSGNVVIHLTNDRQQELLLSAIVTAGSYGGLLEEASVITQYIWTVASVVGPSLILSNPEDDHTRLLDVRPGSSFLLGLLVNSEYGGERRVSLSIDVRTP